MTRHARGVVFRRRAPLPQGAISQQVVPAMVATATMPTDLITSVGTDVPAAVATATMPAPSSLFISMPPAMVATATMPAFTYTGVGELLPMVATAVMPIPGAAGISTPVFTVTRASTPTWLAIEASMANGRKVRFGSEEDPQNVATGIRFSTTLPGGYGDASYVLPRDVRRSFSDVGLLRDSRIYGAGNRTAWGGRLKEVPGRGGADSSLEALGEGWSAHLKDNSSFLEIYVDIDLSHWRGISLQRQKELLQNGNDPKDGSQAWDIVSGAPAIVEEMDGAARNLSPIIEAWYDAGALRPKKAFYDFAPLPNGGSTPYYIETDANFNAFFGNANSEHVYTSFERTSDLAGSHGTSGYITFSAVQQYLFAQFSWEQTTWGHTLGYVFPVRWARLGVYGNHGLTLQGSDPKGLYGSDIIADVISRAAPKLTYSTGTDGTIQPSTFVIPQAAFLDPTTAEQVILFVTALGGQTNRPNDWGCYGEDGKEFFWRAPETYGRSWRVWIGQTTSLTDEGPQIEDAINGVIVKWQDAIGNSHTVGPPGSGMEATDSALQDTDVDNLATVAGLSRWPTLEIGVTTYNIAVQVGTLFLNEAKQRKFRGEITHTGLIMDDRGVLYPPWMVRAGDVVSPMNLPDPGPFRIISTDYNHDSLTVSMALDSPPARLDVMLSRLQAVLSAGGV